MHAGGGNGNREVVLGPVLNMRSFAQIVRLENREHVARTQSQNGSKSRTNTKDFASKSGESWTRGVLPKNAEKSQQRRDLLLQQLPKVLTVRCRDTVEASMARFYLRKGVAPPWCSYFTEARIGRGGRMLLLFRSPKARIADGNAL